MAERVIAPATAGQGASAPVDTAREWSLRLFRRSVLKQEKFRRIAALLPPLAGRTCLDVGADNGVISLLLRERGGTWESADLDDITVESIRRLVGGPVHRIDGRRTPFPDGYFDVVVIVDFLEHIPSDAEFARELARILRPGGSLIVNVPHLKPGSWLNRFRHSIGLTDEKHGHLRPGYDVAGLRALLGAEFVLDVDRTYSKTFSECVDTLLNALYELRGKPDARKARSRKGRVITEAELRRFRKEFLALSLLYPLLWMTAQLDRLLVFQSGYKLIIRARRT